MLKKLHLQKMNRLCFLKSVLKALSCLLATLSLKTQTKKLTEQLRKVIGDEVLIFIDQEGGRIGRIPFGFSARMRPPKALADLAIVRGLKEAKRAVRMQALLSAIQLYDLGINVNCTPLADLFYDFAHNVIGDRSFGSDVDLVTALCKEVDLGLATSSVQSVLKHIPGHGRALSDSHKELPVVETEIEELETFTRY